MAYEAGRWYRPDQTWKDDQAAPASWEARQAKVEATVSQLVAGLLDQFGAGVTVDLQIENEAEASPAFNLLGVDPRESGSWGLLRFADGDGVAQVLSSQITAIRVLT